MTQFFRDQGGTLHQFPDDATPDEMAAAVEGDGKPAAPAVPGPSLAQQGVRGVGYFGKGFNDSAAETIGALPQMVAGGIRRVTGVDLAPQGGYAGAIKRGLSYVGMGGPQGAPQGGFERGAYGAGRGVADAASVALPAAAVARTARAGSLTARVAEGLAAQPVTQMVAGAAGGGVGEATDNPYLGLLASLAVPVAAGAARRLVSPVTNTLTPEQARLAAVAKAEGIPLTAGQQTGSRSLQSLESVLGTMPFSGGMAQKAQQTQREAFNAAVLRRAGINSTSATPDVMLAGKQQLGNEFDRLISQTQVQFDAALGRDLQDVVTNYTNKLPSQQRPVFHQYVADILNAGPTMPGKVYQIARSDLGRQAKALANNDPTLSQALGGLQKALDAAADRAIPSNLRDAWQTVRSQYGNYKGVERAMSTPSGMSASGDIPPAQLWNSVKAQRGVGIATGQGDLNDLSRVGQQFLKQQIPNSGTPERAMWMRWLTGGGLFGGGAVAAGVNPLVAGGAAAGGLAIPPAIQAFIGSPAGKAWLTNQLATGVGPRLDPALFAAITAGRAKEPVLGLLGAGR